VGIWNPGQWREKGRVEDKVVDAPRNDDNGYQDWGWLPKAD